MSPGHELQRLRKAKGLSQQDLAVAVGMTAAAVTQWETGKITPRRNTAALLDDALDAGGQVLAVFGYATGDGPSYEELALLPERVARLEERLLSEQAVGSDRVSIERRDENGVILPPPLEERLGVLERRQGELVGELRELAAVVAALTDAVEGLRSGRGSDGLGR